MKWQNIIRGCEWVLIPLILVAAAFYGGLRYGENRAERQLIAIRDTVVMVTNSHKDNPEPQNTMLVGHIAVPRYKFITDTVCTVITHEIHDTTIVYLPSEQKFYNEEDGKLRIWVSGYEPHLDRYELDLPTTVITQTVTKKNTRWGLSINAGYGIMVNQQKAIVASPYIGCGISYTIFRL